MKVIPIRKPNVKGCGIVTVVRGVRAEQSFWDMCDLVAAKEQTTRNELIIRATMMYCKGNVKCKKQ